ncbi:MAG: hypothetical protein AAGF57_07085 [Pseudomonadota bacterium]
MKTVWVLLSGSLLMGCGPAAVNLKDQASHDLACPKADLQIMEMDRNTRGAVGCGQYAVYQTDCATSASASYQCEWSLSHLESSIETSAGD